MALTPSDAILGVIRAFCWTFWELGGKLFIWVSENAREAKYERFLILSVCKTVDVR